MPYDNPKPVRIKDEAALQRARERRRCEHCGGKPTLLLHPHHIRSRGAGGDDVDENLLGLCSGCHDACHRGLISKQQQRDIAARRQA
jgi:hypothetical protein